MEYKIHNNKTGRYVKGADGKEILESDKIIIEAILINMSPDFNFDIRHLNIHAIENGEIIDSYNLS